MATYSLQLKESSVGEWADGSGFWEDEGEEYMLMSIFNEAGEYAAVMTLTVDEDQCHIGCPSSEEIAELPGCKGPLHLLSAASAAIAQERKDSHEHYTDIFYDGNGDIRQIPFSL